MRELKAMAYLPFIRPDRSLCAVPGYDTTTGVYAEFPADGCPTVPDNPTRAELISAMQTVWHPWSRYRFASSEDRAAMFSAILTAICRPALPTAPAYFFDAPVQSSGKTKAAAALGALVRGERVGVTPFVEGPNTEPETVKKLVALAMAGSSFWLIDNVVGVWRSATLAATITEGAIDERVLGSNLWYRGTTRMMVVATGNNASLDRDLGRRFIRVRIDPGVECPQARSFSFEPVDMALTMRLAISHEVLVLVTAWQAAGGPNSGRGDCGFSDWNRLVRSCVIWLGDQGLDEESGIGKFGDPAHSILESAAADDPDTAALRMLLTGLHDTFGGAPFTAKEVHTLYENWGGDGAIREALEMIMPGRKDCTPASIARVFRYRRDRIAGGLVLRLAGEDRKGVGVWCVVKV